MRYNKCIARRKKIITKKKGKRLGTTLRIGATKKRQQQVVLTDVTVANRAQWWYSGSILMTMQPHILTKTHELQRTTYLLNLQLKRLKLILQFI